MVQSPRKARETHEIFVEIRAVGGVMHLGVELNRIETARCVSGDRIGRVG